MCTNLTVSQVDAVETSQYVNIFNPLLTLNTSTSRFRNRIRIRMVGRKVQTAGNFHHRLLIVERPSHYDS